MAFVLGHKQRKYTHGEDMSSFTHSATPLICSQHPADMQNTNLTSKFILGDG